jgi:hypothetical protein
MKLVRSQDEYRLLPFHEALLHGLHAGVIQGYTDVLRMRHLSFQNATDEEISKSQK